jgi:hypothetical protein
MQPRWLFWKEEAKKRTWKELQDTEQDRQQAIDNGAMFFTWAKLSELISANGQPEPHRWGDFPLDFDCKDDPATALREIKELCLVHLPQIYGLEPHGLRFYASGGKGFHVEIPAKFLDAEDGDPYLPLIYRRLAASWKERFSLTTLDLSIYSMGKGRMWRLPNIKRENGRHKIPLTLEELSGWMTRH